MKEEKDEGRRRRTPLLSKNIHKTRFIFYFMDDLCNKVM